MSRTVSGFVEVVASIAQGLTHLLVHLSLYMGITINYLRPLLHRPPSSLLPLIPSPPGKVSPLSSNLWRQFLMATEWSRSRLSTDKRIISAAGKNPVLASIHFGTKCLKCVQNALCC